MDLDIVLLAVSFFSAIPAIMKLARQYLSGLFGQTGSPEEDAGPTK